MFFNVEIKVIFNIQMDFVYLFNSPTNKNIKNII